MNQIQIYKNNVYKTPYLCLSYEAKQRSRSLTCSPHLSNLPHVPNKKNLTKSHGVRKQVVLHVYIMSSYFFTIQVTYQYSGIISVIYVPVAFKQLTQNLIFLYIHRLKIPKKNPIKQCQICGSAKRFKKPLFNLFISFLSEVNDALG